MEPTVTVVKVFSFNNPLAAIRRLVVATGHSEGMLSHSALRTLVQLTAMAHPMGGEGDIVSATFPTADLERLELYGFIQLADNGAIHLI
ncbi:hypothetical protein ACFW2V_12455 [Streptomyces sp. NPDC058947]|uniref:hypothetical protein n=1 Tax=Streptomyces sp. NPDC058947 TaxID=3346675 RepID=UPI0036CE00FB